MHNHHTTKMPTLTPDELIALGARQAIEQLAPQPIPLSERQPEQGDVLDSGPCSLVWLGQEIPPGYWHWEFTHAGFQADYTHWLPASTRFLPARVEG